MSISISDLVQQAEHSDGPAGVQRCQTEMLERLELAYPNPGQTLELDAVNLLEQTGCGVGNGRSACLDKTRNLSFVFLYNLTNSERL